MANYCHAYPSFYSSPNRKYLQMANNTTDPVEGKKKRKQQGPRQKPLLNILLSVDAEGKPEIVIASYNAQDTLSAYVKATQEGRTVNLVTWQAPASEKKPETTAA